jgi:8-oxo-dGTP diphosphatase
VSPVRAAGGVVLRTGPDGESEVLLVHRPRYDDWTLPKGKLQPGETIEDCALREVEEETSLRTRLGRRIAETRYTDRRGRDKIVTYFEMEPEGEPRARNEVDEVRWVPLDEAPRVLSYERDVDVLANLEK